jgi:predicted Zn-dependent protease
MTNPSRLETLRQMAQKNPGNALARFGYANELLNAEQWEDAEREMSAYLEMHDDEGNGWLRYVDVLHRLGRVDEAKAAVQRGVQQATKHRHSTLVAEFEERAEELENGD